MTLRERRGDLEFVYQDEERLNQAQWSRILGIAPSSMEIISRRGSTHTKREYRRDGTKGGPLKLTPVGDFPSMIAALGSLERYHSYAAHPWAVGVDVSRDFEIISPSGSTFIYEYPRKNVIFRWLKKVVRL